MTLFLKRLCSEAVRIKEVLKFKLWKLLLRDFAARWLQLMTIPNPFKVTAYRNS